MNEFLVLTRAIHFGAVLWLFGELVLFAVVVRPDLRRVSADASADSQEPERRLFRVAGSCLAIGIASTIAWLLLETSTMSGMPLAEALKRHVLDAVVRETLFGRIWLVRLALLLLLSAALWFAWRRQPRRQRAILQIGATLLAGVCTATIAWTGHADAARAGVTRHFDPAAGGSTAACGRAPGRRGAAFCGSPPCCARAALTSRG